MGVGFLAPFVGLEPTVTARVIYLRIIGAYYELLRCPTNVLAANGFVPRRPLPLAQVASSATGSAPLAPYLLRTLSRYSDGSLIVNHWLNSDRNSQKEDHPNGWSSFWLPLLDSNQRPAD